MTTVRKEACVKLIRARDVRNAGEVQLQKGGQHGPQQEGGLEKTLRRGEGVTCRSS